MSKELVIGSNRHETKVAILEEDQLVEVYFQRANEYSLAGSIHKGRVTRVLPGMQSAFVDLGLERDTFLYVSDFFEEHDDIDTVVDSPLPVGRNGEQRESGERRDRSGNRPPFEQPPAPRQVIEPIVIVQESPGVQAPKPLSEEKSVAPIQAISELPQAKATTEGDRNQRVDRSGDRSGDRRGRRSRRRRQRGGGFPENKYAQPGSSTAEGAAPVFGASEVREEEPEPADVMVLPGESLAKYRRISTASQDERFESADPESVDPEELEAEEAPLSEEIDEELEAQAEELELTDKIFSHRENESVEAEEGKLAEVRADEPVSPYVVNDLDTEEEGPLSSLEEQSFEEDVPSSILREPVGLQPDEFGRISAISVREAGTAETFESELDDAAEREGEQSQDEDFPGEVPSGETVVLIESAYNESGALEESNEEYEGADFEDALSVSGDPSEAGPERPTSSSEGQPPLQSATVRDQGERYPHRAPRRMRRRRGGSRFAGGAGLPSTLPSESANSSGPAAAPAFIPEGRREPVSQPSFEKSERVLPSISELLKPGQEIIVQIAKEPLGQKGARITSHIALPGRYVVFMPSVEHLGVSRKIASDEERMRLKRILQTHRVGTTGGFIVRTAGEGVPEDEIAADMNFLYTLWLDIRQKAEKKPAPALLHYDLDVVQRILRDQVTEDFKAIWVDNEELYENVLSFMQRFQPAFVNRVKMYTRSAPIFDAFNITQELEKALRPKVWLKSGGYIVINQTEALVAIDINTGKYVGKSNRLEDTIVKTNTEAVKEIVRQIRLRDLGGIIVVDFIDMDERKNRQKVMQALEEAMRADRAPNKILQFNDFGLVAITRKRVKQSLERTLCAPCPYCEGAGYVKSVQTIISEILIEAQKIARAIEGKDVVLRVNPDVAKVLKSSENKYLEELESILGRPVLVRGDTTLHHEKFDLG